MNWKYLWKTALLWTVTLYKLVFSSCIFMHLIFEETLDCLLCKSESQTVIHGSFLQREEILMDTSSFDKVELLAEVSILWWLTIFQVFPGRRGSL